MPVPDLNDTVTVVIPTTLRPEVASAIGSVRAQLGDFRMEVVVVVDGKGVQSDGACSAVLDGADTVLYTGGRRGASAARNLGIESASGNWIAFLDDDDEWLPTKLLDQFHCLRSSDSTWDVVSCRVQQSIRDLPGAEGPTLPSRLIQHGESVGDYLFGSRGAGIDRPSLFTSTLLVRAEVASKFPWRTALPRHQDWDWLISLQREGNARLCHAPAVGAVIYTNSSNSMSSTSNWRASVEWIQTVRWTMSPKAAANFLAGHCLRYALQARSARGVIATSRAIAELKTLPSLTSIALGLAGLIPRSIGLRALIRVLGRKS